MRSAATLLLATLFAVTTPSRPQTTPQRGPDGSASTRVPGIDVLPLPGMPFTASDTIAWTRSIDGGGTITTYVEANVARDSQGRLYRERHHFAPQDVNPRTTIQESIVSDPVAHTRTTCTFAIHRCVITTYHAPVAPPTVLPAGSFDKGQRFLTRENLGNQTMDGLTLIGTRETTTTAPGVVGNDQALTSTREFWYSEDLKTNLAVTRKSPTEGTAVIRLKILSRAEPDPAIFAVPPGFTVQDNRHPTN
jgi:hypothetical protein